MAMDKLYGKTLEELSAVAKAASLPPYAAKQIAGWLYRRGAPEISGMTDLSLAARNALEKEFETGLTPPSSVAAGSDGGWKLWRTGEPIWIQRRLGQGQDGRG